MPTYALLGATGNVGSHVLTHLLNRTTHQIHCFVRSKSKLTGQLASSKVSSQAIDTRIQIFEGSISDTTRLEECIVNTDVAFLCVAAAWTSPDLHIAQDQAESIITALQSIRSKDSNRKLPKLVVLSSAETEQRLCQEIPAFMFSLLFKANSGIYLDLIAAEKYLRSHSDLVTTIFVKPGGLSHDISRGYEISEVREQTFLSFVDLAGGMVEVADTAVDGERWDNKCVSVLSPGGKAKMEWASVPLLFRGLLVYFFPWISPYI